MNGGLITGTRQTILDGHIPEGAALPTRVTASARISICTMSLSPLILHEYILLSLYPVDRQKGIASRHWFLDTSQSLLTAKHFFRLMQTFKDDVVIVSFICWQKGVVWVTLTFPINVWHSMILISRFVIDRNISWLTMGDQLIHDRKKAHRCH